MNILWPESRWILPAAAALAFVAILLAWHYARASSLPPWVRTAAAALKIAGFAFLLLFLLDPQIVRQVVRPGIHAIALLADTSASMQIPDQAGGKPRSEALRAILADSSWQQPLEANFQVRRYTFDQRVRRVGDFSALAFAGMPSALQAALERVHHQSTTPPLSAILVFTDGAATDFSSPRPEGLPPVYPVLIAPSDRLRDAAIERASASTSAFESAPVTVDASVRCLGAAGKSVTVRLFDAKGAVLDHQQKPIEHDDATIGVRFLISPSDPGPTAYQVEAILEMDAISQNNRQTVVANRDTGARHVLYVAGEPNWEHKFLARALAEDSEIRLVSLLRIARSTAKADWRAAGSGASHPLFQGQKGEEAERYDEPVFLRLGTRDAGELRAGFPRTETELFAYDAVILDNLEATFFTPDQLALLRKFVADRGGSLLVLGGGDSLDAGGYAGTPLVEVLPIYLGTRHASAPAYPVRIDLTREGSRQPWMRLRTTESEEAARIAAMPGFLVAHGLPDLKPGAESLASLRDATGRSYPAIVTERFGAGRSTVFLVGDWWRWGLRGPTEHADLDKFWRQAVRGLLADAPHRAAIESQPTADGTIDLTITALGPDFHPSEKATATLRVRNPAGEWSAIEPLPDPAHPGRFVASLSIRQSGAWMAEALVTDASDGGVFRPQTGWAINPDSTEFRAPAPGNPALTTLAQATGGRIVNPDTLKSLVAELQTRPLSVTETRSEPLWHHAIWLALALACFAGEWSLRRWKGLA